MDFSKRCAVVIPCLNEAEHIGPLVRAICHHVSAVIVIDDGSRDKTAEEAAQAGAEVISHAAPRGKGAALRSGWARASQRGFGWAVMMDGDGQHSPQDIPAFLACAAQGEAALIVGNRMEQAERMPWLRRQVNRWMSRTLSRRVQQEMPDTQCGFRMIDLAALAQLELAADHFETESELILQAAGAGLAIAFIPIEVIYKSEASKIHPLVDTWRWFRWWSGIGSDPRMGAKDFRARKKMRAPK